MTETTENVTPMQKMLMECDGDIGLVGERISAVLEFLTLRAVADTPYMIFTDNEDAMVLFAAGDEVSKIRNAIPEDIIIKRWEDELDSNVDVEEFLTNRDPGDEQPEQLDLELDESDEPAAEQE